MHRYQKWLSVGLLALTPGIAVAGALDSPQLKPGPRSATGTARSAKKSRADANQELAEKIAKALRNAKISGYDIDIDVRDGVVILEGIVAGVEQRSAAAKVARTVPGVTAINNRLRLGDPASKPRGDQSAAERPRSLVTPRSVQQVNYQPGNDRPLSNQPGSIQHAAVYEAEPVGTSGTVTSGTMAPSTSPGTPVYGPPNAYASQPYNNASPTYAQYPNDAAVAYPSQYSTSAAAWPYLGPFYPYPQCPLGWRKVSMQWDAGLWTLDFGNSRTHWWNNPF